MSNASDHPNGSEDNRSLDDQQGNWLTKYFWMLKGLLAALVLVAFGVAILFSFEGPMANVVWAMSVTLAALVVLFQIGIAVVQSTRAI